MERPMPQLNDLSRSLVAIEQDATLIAVIEMGQSSWLVAGIVPGIDRQPLKKLAPDRDGLLQLLYRWRKLVSPPASYPLNEPRAPISKLTPAKRAAFIACLNGGGTLHKWRGVWSPSSAEPCDKRIFGITVADLTGSNSCAIIGNQRPTRRAFFAAMQQFSG
jgi:hypothetical protein